MPNWVFKGLRTGIKTTAYPVRRDDTPGVSPGRPRATLLDSAAEVERLVELCPTQAIERQDGGAAINHGRCVHCFPCWRNEMTSARIGSEAMNGPLTVPTAQEPRRIWKRHLGALCTFVLLMLAPAAPA